MSIATIAIVAASMVLAVGSSDSGEASVGAGPTSPDNAEAVNWSKYAAEVKARAAQLVRNKECSGLPRELDRAADNSEATRSRTGQSNSDLMDYLDNAMRASGCYK